MPVVRKDLTKAQADELMANIREEDPDAQLEPIPQPNGLFTVNIKSAAPTGEPSTTNAPTTASEALQLGDPTVQPDSALLNGPSWLEIARSQIGTKEIPGAGNNPATLFLDSRVVAFEGGVY